VIYTKTLTNAVIADLIRNPQKAEIAGQARNDVSDINGNLMAVSYYPPLRRIPSGMHRSVERPTPRKHRILSGMYPYRDAVKPVRLRFLPSDIPYGKLRPSQNLIFTLLKQHERVLF
jgi:hypothetical protein